MNAIENLEPLKIKNQSKIVNSALLFFITTTFATKVLQDLRREEQKRTEIKKTTQEKNNEVSL